MYVLYGCGAFSGHHVEKLPTTLKVRPHLQRRLQTTDILLQHDTVHSTSYILRTVAQPAWGRTDTSAAKISKEAREERACERAVAGTLSRLEGFYFDFDFGFDFDFDFSVGLSQPKKPKSLFKCRIGFGLRSPGPFGFS